MRNTELDRNAVNLSVRILFYFNIENFVLINYIILFRFAARPPFFRLDISIEIVSALSVASRKTLVCHPTQVIET